MAESLHETVTDLEIRVAYQDRTLTTLDEVVRELHRRIERLEAELIEVRRNVAPVSTIGPANEPPPHY